MIMQAFMNLHYHIYGNVGGSEGLPGRVLPHG
jgi:hypothetical protein